MKTFNDFQGTNDKKAFIKGIINEFKQSRLFKMAIEAQKYYEGENTEILRRLQWFYKEDGNKEQDNFKANNQVPSEFFTKIVKQENSYLLSNGVTLNEKIKKDLGRKFDNKIFKAGNYALIDGVSWGYCYINKKGNFSIDIWRGTEFVPLYDETTGVLRAGIRFWQIDESKPIYIELYEEDGKTEYAFDSDEVKETLAKTAYKIKKAKDILGERVIDEENWSTLPIFPMYGNDTHKSSLTLALKNKIDLYDIIMSDFGNNLEDSVDVYWVIKNYGGQNLEEFLQDYKYYKSVKVAEDGDASPHTIEVPYQARETALEILRKQIFEGAMALDTSVLSGGSLTNVAIKSMMADLDLKTDDFENGVLDFLDDILNLYAEYKGISEDFEEPKLIRRSLINDTEVIDNIVKMRNDIDQETALKLNPYIQDAEIPEILAKIEEENIGKYDLEEPKTEIIEEV